MVVGLFSCVRKHLLAVSSFSPPFVSFSHVVVLRFSCPPRRQCHTQLRECLCARSRRTVVCSWVFRSTRQHVVDDCFPTTSNPSVTMVASTTVRLSRAGQMAERSLMQTFPACDHSEFSKQRHFSSFLAGFAALSSFLFFLGFMLCATFLTDIDGTKIA